MAEGLYYMAKSERLEKDISVLDLKGDQRTGNRGICDLLVFKHGLKRQFFQRETHARANDLLINTDVPFAKWLENDVEPRMKTLKAWMRARLRATLHGTRAGLQAKFAGCHLLRRPCLGPCGARSSSCW